jgi:hypothetical protein
MRRDRPFAEIEITFTVQVAVTPDGSGGPFTPTSALEQLAHMAALGIDLAIVMTQEPLELATLDLIGEIIIPVAAKLVPSGREQVAAAN